MFVVTADQRASRRGSDRVPAALDVLRGVPTRLSFVRTVGDEIQGVPQDATAVLDAVLRLVRVGGWSVGVGVGPGTLGASAPASSGEAFVRAREAVERAKGRTVPIPLALAAGCDVADVESLLHLLAHVVATRSAATWRVVDLLQEGRTGVEAAAELGITPQAVSAHRRAALWDTETGARRAVAVLLEQLDQAES